MSILLLWLLATIDSAFIGYREAAGRSALIDKRDYYRHALVRGALLGQIAVAIAGAVALGMLATSPQPARLFDSFEQVATRMLMVYVLTRWSSRSRFVFERYRRWIYAASQAC